jgi:hypothetical protein
VECLAAAARRLLGLRSPSRDVERFARKWHDSFVERFEQGLREGEIMNNVDTIAITRDAYQAYGDCREWKAYNGQPMPTFEALPDGIRDAWHTATLKAIDSYVRATTVTVREPVGSAPPEVI